jgi:WD40 repeat protein
LIAQLQAADYLRQSSLTELYSRQIADMVLADESMRLLAEGNGEYYALITNLFSYFKNNIVEYMPRAAIALGEYTFGQNAMVTSVAISADGNRVVTGLGNGTAKIVAWNGNAWVEQYNIRHGATVESVAISADGNRVVTGSRDNTANIVTWNGNVWVEQYIIVHTDMVNSVAISADGNRVVTGSDDRTAKIVVWGGNEWIEQYTIEHTSFVASVAISADGNRVVTGSADFRAKIGGWNGNEWIMQYSARHNDRVRSVAISADGTRVVTGAQDGGVMILAWNPGDPNPTTVAWNANELGKQLHAYQWAKDRSVTDADIYWWVVVAISADGNKVVIGSCFHENSIVVRNGDKWIKQYSSSNNRPPAIAISADGTRVVMTSEDNTAKIVGSNVDAWDEQYTIAHNGSVRSVAISADGNRVVTGSRNNSCKIVMFLSTSLPGISDFEGCLFEHLLKWAKTNNQKISKSGWTGDILRRIRWRDVEPVAKNGLQGLIRETMQHGVMQ